MFLSATVRISECLNNIYHSFRSLIAVCTEHSHPTTKHIWTFPWIYSQETPQLICHRSLSDCDILWDHDICTEPVLGGSMYKHIHSIKIWKPLVSPYIYSTRVWIIHTRLLWWWSFHASNRPCFAHDITGWLVRFLWLLCFGGAACAYYDGLWAICICTYEWTSLYPLHCYTNDRAQDVKVLHLCLEMMQLVASGHFTISFAFVTFTHLKYKYNNKRQGHDLPQGI